MENLKILGPKDFGRGILVEYDAGYIDPNERRNLSMIRENRDMLDHSKPFEFYAVLQKYNTPNRNGRIYPEKILKREADNYKKIINKGTSLSELNHPESSLIDLDRVSHMITEIWWDGPVLLGKFILLAIHFHSIYICTEIGFSASGGELKGKSGVNPALSP